MALSGDLTLWIALAAAVAAAALMIVLSRQKAKEGSEPLLAQAGQPGVAGAPAPGSEDLLLRFVVDAQGQRQGETVALDGDKVVLKTPQGFLLVPATNLRVDGANVQYVGDFDLETARREGEEWRARSHKEITYTPDEVPKDEP